MKIEQKVKCIGMDAVIITLTGLDVLREQITVWVAFIILILSFLAFGPKMKASVIGKLLTENRRLKALLVRMTVEETLKIETIALLETEKKTLEQKLIDQHRRDVDGIIHNSETPQGLSS